MRTTWQSLSNETKRGDSVELSRFFVFGELKHKTTTTLSISKLGELNYLSRLSENFLDLKLLLEEEKNGNPDSH